MIIISYILPDVKIDTFLKKPFSLDILTNIVDSVCLEIRYNWKRVIDAVLAPIIDTHANIQMKNDVHRMLSRTPLASKQQR
jgi:hypothetical protein